MWHALLDVGSAWCSGAASDCTRALWRLLVPKDGVAWFERQKWTDVELATMFERFCEVWWRYCAALPGARVGALLKPEDVLRVVDIACEQLRGNARTRSVFVAVLFQLAVSRRHDQMTCCVLADLTNPPFYAHYVNRSHIGSMFSLRTLLQCESKYACAKRTVARFRGVKGRVVAEVFDARGEELIRRPRSKIKRFMCSKCSVRVRPRCKRCTRVQELDSCRLISYYGHHHEWVSVADAQTVCGDVEFVSAAKVEVGARVSHDGADWRMAKRARGRNDSAEDSADSSTSVVLHLERRETTCGDGGDGVRRAQLQCAPKTVVAVQSSKADCFEMMRDNPSVVHGMCMSVGLDRAWRDRWSGDTLSNFAEHSLRVSDVGNLAEVAKYAAWRSAVAVVAFSMGNDATCHPACAEALRAATTHALVPDVSAKVVSV